MTRRNDDYRSIRAERVSHKIAIPLLCGHVVHYRQNCYTIGEALYCFRCEGWAYQRLTPVVSP